MPINIEELSLGQSVDELPPSTTVLIVGGGPIGVLSSILLARYGYDSVVLERHAQRLGQPKAHVINARSCEVLRQYQIPTKALRLTGLPTHEINYVRFVSSVLGIEYGDIKLRIEDDDEPDPVSPEPTFNVPQPLFEDYLLPIALATGKVSYLRQHDWVSCNEEQDHTKGLGEDIVSVVRVLKTNTVKNIRSKYLIGCDGVNATTRDYLGITFDPLYPGPEQVLNYASMHFSADLSHLKPGLLWFVLNPASMGAFIAYNRKNSWVFFLQYDPKVVAKDAFSSENFKELIFKAYGGPIPDYKELGITLWKTTPKLASSYRSPKIRRAFLAGDAAHTFPPTGGLGVNTGIADIQNLIWKIHAVESGWAADSFLDTVSTERLFVARNNCRQSKLNEDRVFSLIKAIYKPGATPEGLMADPVSRANIKDLIWENYDHFDSMDLALGYVYGREHIRDPSHYVKEAVPGARLPHFWLQTKNGEKISSLDLIDGHSFVLITSAGFSSSEKLDLAGVPVSVKEAGKDFVDTSKGWTNILGLTSLTGVGVLVRPDQHIVGSVTRIGHVQQLLSRYLKR